MCQANKDIIYIVELRYDKLRFFEKFLTVIFFGKKYFFPKKFYFRETGEELQARGYLILVTLIVNGLY